MENPNDLQSEVIIDLTHRKKVSRNYLRSLTASEKILQLAILQERYYEMLAAREQNGRRPIPDRWRKWHKARYETANG